MSQFFGRGQNRTVPIAIAAGLFGGLLYFTGGAKQQPRPRATHDATGQMPVSETLQSIAGTGGQTARSADQQDQQRQYDPKDTRIHSADPSAQSKRNPQKVKSDDLGGNVSQAEGKHIGDKGKDSGDLPWKGVGQ
ncbi:hypothetical protein C8A03DRAFT_19305 [Achaetomium macrosporum]|uniref:Uncharacterized protein n=1 Tax=Achaetomium macrosporum TaxID=79813 RepID=A0AAN7C258_9PEZI|nr:hypothetical protein C8A03DRAFT_19305 [Achaetomium macrosporum]